MNEIIIKIQYQYEIEDFIDFQQYIQLRNAHRNKSKIGYLFLIPFIVVFLNLIIIRIDYLLLLNYLSLFCVIIFFNIYNNRNKNTKYQIKSLKKIYPFANFAKSYEIIFYNNKLEIFHNNIIESTVGYNEIKECKNAKKGIYLFKEELNCIIIPKKNLVEDQIRKISELLSNYTDRQLNFREDSI